MDRLQSVRALPVQGSRLLRCVRPGRLPGLSHFKSEEPSKVVGIPPSLKAFAVDTEAGLLVLAQEVEGNVAQDRQVLIAVVFADATLVFAKSYV